MNKAIRIALAVPVTSDCMRGVIRGVLKYSGSRPWLLERRDAVAGNDAGGAAVAGMIAAIESAGQWDSLSRCGIPVVSVTRPVAEPTIACVTADDRAVGDLAASHMLERGMKRFAFVGYQERSDSDLRRAGFVERLGRFGFAGVESYGGDEGGLSGWLMSLAKPTALLAADDALGAKIVEICRENSIAVPGELAVMGVGNDSIACGLTSPPMSSVDLPAERMGFEAAVMLERLLSGQSTVPACTQMPVSSVIAQASTDIVAIDDPHVAAAVRFILAHAGEWIGVPELLLAVPIQRRSLERKFKQSLGRTPLEEIRRVRVEIARQLLSSTDLPMPIVALQSGFSEAKQLSMIFRSEVGMTPTMYRAQFRVEAITMRPGDGDSELPGKHAN